jgi:hypothetical protein
MASFLTGPRYPSLLTYLCRCLAQLSLAVLIRFYHVWRLWKVIGCLLRESDYAQILIPHPPTHPNPTPLLTDRPSILVPSAPYGLQPNLPVRLQLWMFKIYLGRDSAFAGEDVRRLLNKARRTMPPPAILPAALRTQCPPPHQTHWISRGGAVAARGIM